MRPGPKCLMEYLTGDIDSFTMPSQAKLDDLEEAYVQQLFRSKSLSEKERTSYENKFPGKYCDTPY